MSTARVSIPNSSPLPQLESHQHASSSHNTHTRNGAVQSRQVTWRRSQWETKIASFKRGLVHVMQCTSADACGSALCHSTRRLMRTYATHECPKRGNRVQDERVGDGNKSTCKVCKLMSFILSTDVNQRDREMNHHEQRMNTPFPMGRRVPRLVARRPSPLVQLHSITSLDVIKTMSQRM